MGLLDWVEDKASDAYSVVSETATDLYHGASDTLSDAYQGVKTTASGVYDDASGVASSAWGGIKDTASTVWDGAKSAGETLLDDGGDAYDWVKEGAGSTFSSIYDKIDEWTSDSGLGSKVDELMKKSPTLSGNIQKLQDDGWTIRYGEKGKGTFADSGTKTITVDPEEKGDTPGLVQSLAHESGHALYTMDPEVGMKGKTKDQYVKQNTMRDLKDEGEATIMNMQVRKEIMDATGKDKSGKGAVDIGVAGAQGKKYLELYAKYPDPKDRDKLREEIGKVYAHGEEPSVPGSKDYYDYYSKDWKQKWDDAHK